MTLRSSAVRQLIRTQGGRWCRRGCRISPHGHVLGSRAHIRHQPGACDAVPPARGPWCPARLPSLSAHPGSIHAVSWLGNQCLSRASVSDTGLGLGVEHRPRCETPLWGTVHCTRGKAAPKDVSRPKSAQWNPGRCVPSIPAEVPPAGRGSAHLPPVRGPHRRACLQGPHDSLLSWTQWWQWRGDRML